MPSEPMLRRSVLGTMALVAAVAGFSGCLGGGGDLDERASRSPTQAQTVGEQRPAKRTALRLVRLHALNGSGVQGAVRLLLHGRELSVESFAAGAAPGRVHMQHLHSPPAGGDGICPTRSLDANGDGLVSLEEGVGAYGPPVVSLEPFPKIDETGWRYAANLTVPAGLALDRGVIVLHGMRVQGEYDELMPIACGAIDDALTREVSLEPVNNSVIGGTARVSLAGSKLDVWVSLGGRINGRTHMQHVHLPEGKGPGKCPTADLDRNGDGLVSLEEGLPAYGAPAVSLEPFPAPTGLLFEYSRTLRVAPRMDLDRSVIVVHGMEVTGNYDETIPVACGAIDTALPAVRPGQSGVRPLTGGHGAGGGSGGAGDPYDGY